MESIESHGISQESNKEKERYKDNVTLLEKAKDKFVEMGLFDKDFLNGLSFVFIDRIEKEGDILQSYQLTSEGEVIPIDIDEKELTNGNNFFVYSNTILDNLRDDPDSSFEKTDKKNQSTFFWLENIDFKAFYSFEAVSAHEIAHSKSYAAITEKDSLSFDQDKFKVIIKDIVENSEYSQEIKNIDFSKFDHSHYDWSELYALLYHREFLRRKNSEYENMIKEWDKYIIGLASDLEGAIKKFNKKRDTDIYLEMIYEDCHAFSFLMARVFEEKYADFNDRIKILESCKKN